MLNNINVSPEEPPFIYHYTNGSGLYGILESQCLWATHYKFLNDLTELVNFKKLFKNRIFCELKEHVQSPKYKDFNGDDGFIENIYKDSVETLYSQLKEDEFYIVSFSKTSDLYIKENGLLSQWRGYGKNGGYAIEIGETELRKRLLEEVGIPFAEDCIYTDNIDIRQQDDDINIICGYAKELFDATCFQTVLPPDSQVDKALYCFLRCAVRYKNHAFEEEKEFRMALLISGKHFAEVEGGRKFREKDGMLIPYMELFKKTETKLPINRIVIGPHKDKEFRAEALRIWLRNKGINDIKVAISDIPFIE